MAFSEDVSSSVDTSSNVGRNSSKGDDSVGGSVGARVALWTKMLEQERTPPPPLDGALGVRRRARSARFKTQPVTLEEVAHAHALNSSLPATDSAITSTQTTPHHQEIGTNWHFPPHIDPFARTNPPSSGHNIFSCPSLSFYSFLTIVIYSELPCKILSTLMLPYL